MCAKIRKEGDGFVGGGEGKQDWLGHEAWMWHNWREAASGEEEGKEAENGDKEKK